jgi:hypothetical protein
MALTYRRYALHINKGSYRIWNYYDSKKSMLKDFALYKTGKAIAYIFKKDAYTLLPNL